MSRSSAGSRQSAKKRGKGGERAKRGTAGVKSSINFYPSFDMFGKLRPFEQQYFLRLRTSVADDDIAAIREAIQAPLNFEMAATDEMIAIALNTKPNAACIVPERREEVTTEGGLAVVGNEDRLTDLLSPLKEAGIRLSLFIEANEADIDSAKRIGADIVELHTGSYCNDLTKSRAELRRISRAAAYGANLGIEIHAGHGLGFDTVGPIASIPEIEELNIGHFLIGESVFCGLESAITLMRQKMQSSRYGK